MAAAKKAPTRTRRAVGKTKAATKAPKKKVVSKPASQKKQKKLHPAKKGTFVKENPVTLPRSVSLATLAAFLIPNNPDQIAISTARYAGTFFVIVGAVFAFLGLHQMDAFYSVMENVENTSHLAQVGEGNGGDPEFCDLNPNDPQCESSGGVSVECNDESAGNYNYDVCFPQAYFSGELSSSVDGIIRVELHVENATQVSFQVVKIATEQDFSVGIAEKINATTWESYWDTAQHSDGEYRIIASITNPHNIYTHTHTATIHVTNEGVVTPQSSCTVSISQTKESTEPGESFNINWESINANSCQAEKWSADDTYYSPWAEPNPVLGDTSTVGTRTDTLTLEGQYAYKIICDTSSGGPSCYSNLLNHYVIATPLQGSTTPPSDINTDSTSSGTASVASSTDTDLDVVSNPEITILVDKANPLEGQVVIKVFVEGADKVKLLLKNTEFGTNIDLGRIDHVAGSEWKYIWDTGLVANNDYKIFAIATIDGTAFDTDPYYVNVVNHTQDSLIDLSTDMTPEIILGLVESNPLHGEVSISIEVPEAEFIELYAKPKNSLTEYYLGRAVNNGVNLWKINWDTINVPNGEFDVFARVRNQFGLYYSDRIYGKVYNEPVATYTEIEEVYVQEIADTQTFVEEQYDVILDDQSFIETVFAPAPLPPQEFTQGDAQPQSLDNDSRTEFSGNTILQNEVETILERFREELKKELDLFARAVRLDDVNKIEKSRDRILKLRKRVIDSVAIFNDGEVLLKKIDTYLTQVVEALEVQIERNEEIIKERTGDSVFEDSDQDGVSDYDEVNLYSTDPFSADSDNDGFNDGVEILNGFDPNDSAAESLVTYESPQEVGVVNDEVFEIVSIATIQPDDENELTEVAAVITGRALPNSFVTLYIFSTPIVVTVKTSDDGSWSYTFDKELEDGEHEVYVGVTDNAGRIVAKSNPLPFVKTAQAFTPVDAASGASVTPSSAEGPSFLSGSIILIILSLAVVMLGLVLIMLGMHIQTRQHLIHTT
ncbi:Ig-like domain-containing protein [Candidatus Pacebacteria bacterium]|nr:Ig-like domain-containing protein [Candidatus Paceibacterota bacterium]